MSRLSAKDRRAAEVAFFGPLIRRVLHALDLSEAAERKAKAEVADLKARMKALRAGSDAHPWQRDREAVLRITDLRVKNWRKP